MTTDVTFKIKQDDQNYRFNYRVAAIIETNDKILVHKFLDSDYWFLPGGRVQIGEIAQDAVLRELKEELDIEAKVSGFPFIVENLFRLSGELFHEICLFFNVDPGTSELPKDHEIRDNVQFLWIHKSKINDYNLQPEFLKNTLNGANHLTQHIVNRSSNLVA